MRFCSAVTVVPVVNGCGMQCTPANRRMCLCTGESYLLLDRSLRELITHLAVPLAGRTRCGWPVSLVSWRPCNGGGGGGAVLHGAPRAAAALRQVSPVPAQLEVSCVCMLHRRGQSLQGADRVQQREGTYVSSAMSAAAGLLGHAPLQNLQSVLTCPRRSIMDPLHKGSTFASCICRVLVTAPLRALQAGGIRFQPPLPPRKQVLPVSCSRQTQHAANLCHPRCRCRTEPQPHRSLSFLHPAGCPQPSIVKPSLRITPEGGVQAAMGRLRMGSAVKFLLGFSHPGAAPYFKKRGLAASWSGSASSEPALVLAGSC